MSEQKQPIGTTRDKKPMDPYREQLDQFFDERYQEILTLARSVLKHFQLGWTPEMLANQTFINLTGKINHLDDRDQTRFAFLKTIMRNLCTAEIRRQSTQKRNAAATVSYEEQLSEPGIDYSFRNADLRRLVEDILSFSPKKSPFGHYPKTYQQIYDRLVAYQAGNFSEQAPLLNQLAPLMWLFASKELTIIHKPDFKKNMVRALIDDILLPILLRPGFAREPSLMLFQIYLLFREQFKALYSPKKGHDFLSVLDEYESDQTILLLHRLKDADPEIAKIFVLWWIFKFRQKDLALYFGVSTATINTRLMRARLIGRQEQNKDSDSTS